MARPIKMRNTRTWKVDVASLTRLRTAIKMDIKLDSTKVKKAIRNIDNLVESIIDLQKPA